MTMTLLRRRPARIEALAWLVAVAAIASACSGSEAPAGSASAPVAGGAAFTAASTPAGATSEAPSTFAFPMGPAAVVPAGYEPPGDIVDSTGAFLPANGKPTLVYVDAIW